MIEPGPGARPLCRSDSCGGSPPEPDSQATGPTSKCCVRSVGGGGKSALRRRGSAPGTFPPRTPPQHPRLLRRRETDAGADLGIRRKRAHVDRERQGRGLIASACRDVLSAIRTASVQVSLSVCPFLRFLLPGNIVRRLARDSSRMERAARSRAKPWTKLRRDPSIPDHLVYGSVEHCALPIFGPSRIPPGDMCTNATPHPSNLSVT